MVPFKNQRELQDGVALLEQLRTYGSQDVFRDFVNDHDKTGGRVCWPGYTLVVREENVSVESRVTHPPDFPGRVLR